jgi:hypothetical protein
LESTSKKIWVLGANVTSADKSISWKQEMPNLANSDILIIDINSRPNDLSYIDNELKDYLRRMIVAQKYVIIVLPVDIEQFHNFLWSSLPVTPELIKIKPCEYKEISLANGNEEQEIPEIIEYSKYVESCKFLINSIDTNYFWNYLNRQGFGTERYAFSSKLANIARYNEYKLMNVCSQTIGMPVTFSLMNEMKEELHRTGTIVFLPPPTKISSNEAIEVLVNTLIGAESKEQEPDWATKIMMPHTEELNLKITANLATIEKLNTEIVSLETERNKIDGYRKILWSNDTRLENIVRNSFKLMGFGEIRRGRSKELEDLIFDFQTTKEFELGVIEVKGRERKTSLEDLNQCDKWVKQYRVKEGKKVKGIFISNQFRRTESESSKLRLRYEPNEIEFAKDFNLCIIPTIELFKAVVQELKGKSVGRSEIERRILNAKPVCKIVD